MKTRQLTRKERLRCIMIRTASTHMEKLSINGIRNVVEEIIIQGVPCLALFQLPFDAIHGMDCNCFKLGQAFLLQQFIVYFGNEDRKSPVVGFAIATAIFLCSVGKYTSMNRFASIHFRIRSQVYSSLGTFVYQKAINLSAEARKNKNSGEIINNLAVDVTKISQLAMYAFVVNLPFRIIVGIWALYRLLGVSALFGFATAVVLIPLSSKISTSISGLVKKNMKIRDERLKLTSEILQSIKSIKLYAWEQPMLKRLFGIRNDKELVMAKRIGHFNAFSMFLWNTIPFAITIACLISFVKLTNISLIPSIIFQHCHCLIS